MVALMYAYLDLKSLGPIVTKHASQHADCKPATYMLHKHAKKPAGKGLRAKG